MRMKISIVKGRGFVGALCLLLCVGVLPLGVSGQIGDATPRVVVIVSRHGVRSPTVSNEAMAPYAAQAWPRWDVPPGYLTPRGKQLMALMGAYYRARYVADGLLSGNPQEDRRQLYFRADNDERTIETARGLAQGLIDEDTPEVHSMPDGVGDPLFRTVRARVGKPDRSLGAAAINGRVGGNLQALVQAYRPEFLTLHRVLYGESAGALPPGKIALLDLPVLIQPGADDNLADAQGPILLGSRFVENFVLEYAEGMPEVGWGRVTRESLTNLLRLQAVHFEMMQRTFYPAQVQVSNLADHVLRTLEQAAEGRSVPGALGGLEDRLVIVVGHDSNLASLGGLLGMSWIMEGVPMNPTLPGGALVFELWASRDSGRCFVRTYYIAQTLDQMRTAQQLTLKSPPSVTPVFIPECGSTKPDYEAPFERFQAHWQKVIDPEFVTL